MKLIDNINDLLGDDIKQSVQPVSRLKIAASTFSIYAFEALKHELESVESFEFIFTSPTFIPDEVTDAAKKERREFHIPKSPSETQSERSFSPRGAVGLGADGISCCGSVVFSSSKKGCSFRIPVSFQSVKPHRKVSKRHSTSVYLSFIIHSARTETSIITEFGGSFHGLFTKYTNSRVSIRQKGL